jgi:large conductance mechanosensitive channel protein
LNFAELEKSLKRKVGVTMQKFLQEFKAFALKGNVLDLAVAVVIGGAFGKIVSSLVNTIIMPLVGILLGGLDFSGLSFTVGQSVIKYGEFIQSVVDFLIIALAIFTFIKILTAFQNKAVKPEEKAVDSAVLATEYLKEIRDLLKTEQDGRK